MNRFDQTEIAVSDRLRLLKAKPEKTFNLTDISVPLADVGFTQEEIMAVLTALEQDRMIAFIPGSSLLMLKKLGVPAMNLCASKSRRQKLRRRHVLLGR